MSIPSMETIVSLAKRRGFVFPSSEIYGGMSSTYDFGPLGVELVNNVKQLWWKHFVHGRVDMVGIDASILMHPRTWEASGHVGGFSDPLMDCKDCNERWRADKIIEEFQEKNLKPEERKAGWPNESTPYDEMSAYITDNNITCPNCGALNYTDIRKFNLMFKTYQGVIEDDTSIVYLRPETCQGIFVDFKNTQQTSRKKVPFGIAQIGKAFRNEITPGNFIFRVREFEQMEIEYFVHPNDWKEKYTEWQESIYSFLTNTCGLREENLRWRQHDEDELSHYSSQTYDVEFHYPFGWSEMWGFAMRGDFDLKQHEEFSGEDMKYFDPHTNEKYHPYVLEPSVGVGRLTLAMLLNSYKEEQVGEETRVVLQLPKAVAPYKIAVLPLATKLSEDAEKVFNHLKNHFSCDFDVTQSIGKRYRRQDEIGTPYCVTFDFDSLEDGCVTIRDRDTMEQERVKIEDLVKYFAIQFV